MSGKLQGQEQEVLQLLLVLIYRKSIILKNKTHRRQMLRKELSVKTSFT